MSKKNWIMIKRGLSEDAEHREAMGVKVWLFMHIIDRADWPTGKVFEWRDKEEAEDMGMSWRTLQSQRQELESMNYITCIQKQDHQEIIIHEWVNPRDYSGGVVNSLKQGTQIQVPTKNGGTPQGTHKGSSKPRTPTLEDQGSGVQVTPTNEIKKVYETLIGYPLNGEWKKGESAAAKNIGYKWTVDQLSVAYKHYKSDNFWADKRLTLQYLDKNMPEFFKSHQSQHIIDPNEKLMTPAEAAVKLSVRM